MQAYINSPKVTFIVCSNNCAVLGLVAQSCLTLCDLMDCNPPGSSVPGVIQAKILEWVAIPFSRGSSQPRDLSQVSCTVSDSILPTGKPCSNNYCTLKKKKSPIFFWGSVFFSQHKVSELHQAKSFHLESRPLLQRRLWACFTMATLSARFIRGSFQDPHQKNLLVKDLGRRSLKPAAPMIFSSLDQSTLSLQNCQFFHVDIPTSLQLQWLLLQVRRSQSLCLSGCACLFRLQSGGCPCNFSFQMGLRKVIDFHIVQFFVVQTRVMISMFCMCDS